MFITVSQTLTELLDKKKISKAIDYLKNIIYHPDLIDISWTLHSTNAEYKLFSSVHDTLTKADPILDHKTRFHKFKSTEVIQSTFSDHFDEVVLGWEDLQLIGVLLVLVPNQEFLRGVGIGRRRSLEVEEMPHAEAGSHDSAWYA